MKKPKIKQQEYSKGATYITEWTQEHKGKYVLTGMQMPNLDIIGLDARIGKVAQIRLESGAFGSDCVVLRHCNDMLIPHENQAFWLIADEFIEYLDSVFKDTYADDADVYDYTLQGKFPFKGFIMPSPIKEGESTPMRNIKKSIKSKIDEILSNESN